jgi:hypothetical protein
LKLEIWNLKPYQVGPTFLWFIKFFREYLYIYIYIFNKGIANII